MVKFTADEYFSAVNYILHKEGILKLQQECTETAKTIVKRIGADDEESFTFYDTVVSGVQIGLQIAAQRVLSKGEIK